MLRQESKRQLQILVISNLPSTYFHLILTYMNPHSRTLVRGLPNYDVRTEGKGGWSRNNKNLRTYGFTANKRAMALYERAF